MLPTSVFGGSCKSSVSRRFGSIAFIDSSKARSCFVMLRCMCLSSFSVFILSLPILLKCGILEGAEG